MEYMIYARKSSDREDKQVQSIPDQVTRLIEIADKFNIKIVMIFKEAKSAKKPYIRPKFEKMMNQIENNPGKFGILCWELNRLSRNPIDSGRISWLLQQGIIGQIYTIDRQYNSDDNVLLYNVITGMANQYILDLRKDVKRGIDSKLRKGWAPYKAPLGYLNEPYNHTIIIDEDRFDKVNEVFDLYLSRQHTVDDLLNIINKKLKLTLRKRSNRNEISLSRSHLYRILRNPFYTGKIPYNGKLYEGKHKPMISEAKHQEVLRILSKTKGRSNYGKKFKYSGIFKCPNCGYSMTAEEKIKKLRCNDDYKVYIYYHCTYKSKEHYCRGIQFVREEQINILITELLSSLSIPKHMHDKIMKEITNIINSEKYIDLYNSKKQISQMNKQIDRLIDLRCKSLISEDEFMKKKQLYESNRDNASYGMSEKINYLNTIKTYVINTLNLTSRFMESDNNNKIDILSYFGSEYKLSVDNIDFTPSNEVFLMNLIYNRIVVQKERFEPSEIQYLCGDDAYLQGLIHIWLGSRDSNPDSMIQSHEYCRCTTPQDWQR